MYEVLFKVLIQGRNTGLSHVKLVYKNGNFVLFKIIFYEKELLYRLFALIIMSFYHGYIC